MVSTQKQSGRRSATNTADAPTEAIDVTATGASQFEKRYGFLGKPLRIRFRLLDPRIPFLHGANQPDISLDARSFAEIDPGVARVFITENEINYLAFPDAENSLVLFGAGYGFEMLRGVEWLSKASVHYWGDIDTHGFAILDQLRCQLGGVQSLLMDRETLFAFQSQWGAGRKAGQSRFATPDAMRARTLSRASRKPYPDEFAP